MIIRPQPKPPKEPKPFNTLDIETDSEGRVMDIGMLYTQEGEDVYVCFRCWEDAMDRMVKIGKKNKDLRRWYAHNGANFDWLSFAQDLLSSKVDCRITEPMAGSNGISMRIALGNRKGTLYLMDSARLLPASLAKLADEMKVEHRKKSIGMLPQALKELDEAAYYEYLMYDCYALREVLQAFTDTLHQHIAPGEIKSTIASTSYTLWRDYYLKHPILTPMCARQKALFRESYRGGRVEVFRPGEVVNLYSYDINSMYPYVMANFPVPSSYKGGWTYEFDSEQQGIYTVKFSQPIDKPAVLCVDGAGVYEGQGTFCSPELHLLREVGGQFTVIEGFVFEESEVLFKDYIETLYALRRQAQKDGNTSLSFVCKILMNSLYGKFGQSSLAKSIETIPDGELERIMEEAVSVSHINNASESSTYLVEREKPIENEMVPIASFITSQSRVQLYRLMLAMGKNSLIYCDTDAVYGTRKLPDTMVGTELGQAKLEKNGEEGQFIGKKLYATKKDGKFELKAKGVPVYRSTVSDGDDGHPLAYDDYRDMAAGQEKLCEFTSPPTPQRVLLENFPACKFSSYKRTLKMLTREKEKLIIKS